MNEATLNLPPLLVRLVEQCGARWSDLETSLETNLDNTEHTVLLIAGDPVRFPEGMDVAAVLPELHKHFARTPQQFSMRVALPACEDALADRYAAQRRPCLIFFRAGKYLGQVEGMLDWDDFVLACAKILAREPSRIPGIGIPVRVLNANQNACH